LELRDEILRLLKITPSLSRLAKRFEKCQRDAILFYCEQYGERYAVPYACNLVICEHCSRRIGRRTYKRYLDRIKDEQDLKHVTLTWGPWKPEHWHSERDIPWICRGAEDILEQLRCRAGDPKWHVHIHAIVSGGYVPQGLLSKTASHVLGRPVVWINRATPRRLGYLLKHVSKSPEFPQCKGLCAISKIDASLQENKKPGRILWSKGKTGPRC
jgi:hypothetical protein